MEKSVTMNTREDIEFIKGFLCLLKETDLFGPMIEEALEAVDRIDGKSGQFGRS